MKLAILLAFPYYICSHKQLSYVRRACILSVNSISTLCSFHFIFVSLLTKLSLLSASCFCLCEIDVILTSISNEMTGMGKHAKGVDMVTLVNSMKQELDYYWTLGEDLVYRTNSCLIYRVQRHIKEADRSAYEPFVVSVGPYHHGAAASQSMQKLKWTMLDYILKLNCGKTLMDYLTAVCGIARQARHCYTEDIEMNNEDFIKMLLLDGCLILVTLGGTKQLLADRQKYDNCSNLNEVIVEEDGKGPITSQPVVTDSDLLVENNAESQESKRNDAESGNCNWLIRFFNHDIFLIENQIPFFVVTKIYEVVSGNKATDTQYINEIVEYVETSLRFYPKAIQECDRPQDFHHLLHLCHMYFIPNEDPHEDHPYLAGPQYVNRFLSFGRKYLKLGYLSEDIQKGTSVNWEVSSGNLESGMQLNRWRRVAQYMEAGIKFKKRDYDALHPHCLLDVKFTNGVMEIPCIAIDEQTGSLFRNLIAFEQTSPQFGDCFTAYIVLLSQLVSMPEDVVLLGHKEIIVHHLDSDEDVSDLFTSLSKDVVFDFNGKYYLKNLCQTMEGHYQSRLNRWMAWLWMNHFSNPWLVLAALATVIVLICTVVQTVFAILAYMSPPGTL